MLRLDSFLIGDHALSDPLSGLEAGYQGQWEAGYQGQWEAGYQGQWEGGAQVLMVPVVFWWSRGLIG
jgi:hypothetical protein